MRAALFALLISALFSACGKTVRVPEPKAAYRVTTHDWEFIAKVPDSRGDKNLDDLRKVAACVEPGGVVIFEVIRLQNVPTQKPKK